MSTSIAAGPRSSIDPAAVRAAERGGEWWLVGGVAAELSERLAVPVGFIRLLLFFGSFAQGDVLVAYVVAALLLPRAGLRAPGAINLIAAARVGIAFVLLWGLSGGGVSLDQSLGATSPAVWVTQWGVCLVGLLALLATGVPSGDRDRARDRRTVLVAGPLVALVGACALGTALLPDVRWDQVLAGLTIVAGLAIVAGRPAHRTAGLVVPAAILAAATLLLAGAGTRLEGGVGDARFVPTGPAAVPAAYRRAVGDLTIDLTSLPPSPVVVTVQASVGIGTLVIDVPPDAAVSVDERVGRGQLYSSRGPRFGLDLRHSGLGRALDVRTGRTLRGQPRRRLRIVADVGIGHLDVERTGDGLGSFGPL